MWGFHTPKATIARSPRPMLYLFFFFYNDNHPVQVPKTLDVADFVKMQFIRIGEEDDG